MSARIPLPIARVGDVIVGDIHPSKGFVMFKVGRAYRNEHFNWVYVSDDGKDEIIEQWIENVYKQKGLK